MHRLSVIAHRTLETHLKWFACVTQTAAETQGGHHRHKGLAGTTQGVGHSGTEGKDFMKEKFKGGGNKRQGVSCPPLSPAVQPV